MATEILHDGAERASEDEHSEAVTPELRIAQRRAALVDKRDNAMRVHALLRWVSEARDTLETLEIAASRDPALRDLLKAHHIAYAAAPWDEQEQDGYEWAFHELQSAIYDLWAEANRG